MNNPNSKTTTFMKSNMSMSWTTSTSRQRPFMKTNLTMSWTTPTPRQRPSIIIKRCLKYTWLQVNDLHKNQYDDVMNNTNSKTTTFMKTNMTMSWTTPTPRQRPLWKPIWRCHERPQLQDNDPYENQYDDVMNNPNSKTTTFIKTNMTMSWTTSTPWQRSSIIVNPSNLFWTNWSKTSYFL